MNLKMKMNHLSILFLALAAVFFFACKNEEEGNHKLVEEIQTEGKISSIIRSPITADGLKDTVNVAKMTFAETEFDFGDLKEGESVEHVFKFKNTGKIPLLIDRAASTCGCTIPEWPKDPVSPGAESEILVRFNTQNKTNRQEKTVSITANTYPSISKIKIKAFVNPVH